MMNSKVMRIACVAGLASVCVFGLAACNSGSSSSTGLTGGIAATVNGSEIPEDTITAYVENFRTASAMDTEEPWGKWLAENSYTPDSVRTEVIDYYVSQELIKKAAEENGATVDSAKIDEAVSTMKANYESEEKWQEALASANTTEQAYRESVELIMTENALKEKVGEPAAITDEELLQYAQMYATSYDGAKKSSHVLFDAADEATANEVLAKINAGELSLADAAKQYSKDTGSAATGGDVGWDKLTSFVQPYTDALTALSKDQVSGLVKSEFGFHIIQCTDVFTAPETVTSTDQIPAEFLDSIKASLESSKQTEAFNTWFTTYKEGAEIVVNPMPENVPYALDMAKYPAPEKDAEDAATDGSGAAGDGATVSNSDGSTTKTNTDGSTVTTNTDGTVVTKNIDGTSTKTDAEGTVIETLDAEGNPVEPQEGQAN